MEQVVTHDRVDVHDNAHQHDHVSYAGYGPNQRRHYQTQVPNGRDQAHDPQESCQTRDHCEMSRGRDQSENYHQEVENIPAVSEVLPRPWPKSQHFQNGFDYEHSERNLVAQMKKWTISLVNG